MTHLEVFEWLATAGFGISILFAWAGPFCYLSAKEFNDLAGMKRAKIATMIGVAAMIMTGTGLVYFQHI